ncbi:MAG TPA: hypothetical protein VN200_12145 [Rhodoglobus sp.]|nr:hypothetical protein [Rhodoglobus sp.]
MSQVLPRREAVRGLMDAARSRRELLGGGLTVIGAGATAAYALSIGLGGIDVGDAPGILLASVTCAVGVALRQSGIDERDGAAGPPPGHPDLM